MPSVTENGSVGAVERYYWTLRAHFVPALDLEGWWPASDRFEIVVGAILVQNTAWSNVDKALTSLRAAGCLSAAGIRRLTLEELGELIRSSGCWRQKAERLRGFVAWLDRAHGGELDRMLAQPMAEARAQLLAQRGIGPETADAILLYAGHHPSFVIDAYTRRIFARHGLDSAKAAVEAQLPRRSAALDARLYREYHALAVATAQRYCRKRDPDCAACPLRGFLPAAEAL